MTQILNVAEKPSVAKAISQLLNAHPQVEDTNSLYNKVYKFPYNIFNQECEMLFTSVSGHLVSLKYLEKYKNWQQWDPYVILNAEVESYIPDDKKSLEKNLTGLSRRSRILILWLDCDREGEAIAFEVLEVCRKSNPHLEVYRAHFSALTKTDISNALNQLRMPDQNLSNAVLGRQEIDLRIGAAFTRFQTLLLRKNYSLQGIISYGPCQFPTLGFVVDRFLEVEQFRSEPFWQLVGNYVKDGQNYKFSWDRGKLFDEYVTMVFYEMCLDGNDNKVNAKVNEVNQHNTRKLKPLPLATIDFEKIATKKLRISAHKAMEIAEKLYNQGYISYPRTETNKFPSTMNLKNLIAQHKDSIIWGDFASNLLDGNFEWPRAGTKDDKAHPPIHPVKLMTSNQNELEFKVYELISRHFLATCSKNALGKETNLKINVKDEYFSLKGLVITEENYLAVYPYDKWAENIVPSLNVKKSYQYFSKKGETIQLFLEMISGQTTPPPFLTETELIKLMDKNGIGTDATIHEHIKTIQDREYAKKIGQIFKPTKLGIALVETYRSMGTSLHLPNLRAEMEQQMNQIALGQLEKQNFVKNTIFQMGNILKGLQDNKNTFIQFVGTYLQQLANYSEDGEVIVQKSMEMGLCGKCNSNIQYQEISDGSKKLRCNACQLDLKLPFEGNVIYKPQTCPICKFQIIDIKKDNGNQYTICPYCYSNNQQENEKLPCFKCTFSGCPLSSASRMNGIPYNCIVCRNSMVLIEKTKKNTMFVGCSAFPKCRSSSFLPDMISKIELTEVKCEECKNQGFDSLKCKLNFTDDELIFGNLLRRSSDPDSLYCLYPQCDKDIGKSIKWNNANGNNNQGQSNQSVVSGNNNQNKSTQFSCFKCGEQGHFAPNCPQNRNSNQEQDRNNKFNQGQKSQKNNNLSNIQCYRCKQMGHYASSCGNNDRTQTEPGNKQQEKKGKNNKMCSECGIEGRHPKTSQCSLKRQRKKNKQQKDEDNGHDEEW